MLLIGNGRLITNDVNNPFIENGAVIIENGLVSAVGNYNDLKNKYPKAEFIDAKGKVIMPGIINTHMHIYSSFARGKPSDGKPTDCFLNILENLWWKIDRNLSLDDIKYSAYNTLIESIKCGVTTVFDHHAGAGAVEGSLETIAGVSQELGLRLNLCFETSDRDGKDTFKREVKENIDFIKKYNSSKQDMVKGMFGMHAPFTLSDESLEYCAKEMAGIDAGYHVHVAEGIEDLKDSFNKYGKTLIDRLYSHHILGEKTIAVHCIYINEHEMDLVKSTKTNVVHNPESNMGNAVGCSPVIRMMEKGINVGLGTDGYTADMFESMKVANIIHKHVLCNPTVAWGETPKMLFENNRTIAGKYFSKPAGILAPGAFGDAIIVDYDPFTPMNKDNYNSHILFGMMGRSVTDTIVGGKVLMRDRVISAIDEKEICAKSRELANKLWNRLK